MSTFKKTVSLFSLIFLFQCNQPGFGDLSSNNIKGKDAKKKLVESASTFDTLYLILTDPDYSYGFATIVTAINEAIVPIVANIEDSEYYEQDSVDDCVKKINSFFIIADSFITIGLTCDIKKAKLLDLP
ncbi:MAG: TIGR04452 family lipoprotein [Leptospira sp.]|nr:TIGR04452 family lipoprotein [Leptospira sp.]